MKIFTELKKQLNISKLIPAIWLIILIFQFNSELSQAQPCLDSLAPYWGVCQGPNGDDVRVLSIDSSNRLYAGIWGKGIYRSNAGANWTNITNNLGNLFITAIEFDSTAGNIFISTLGGGIFKSTNLGDTWTGQNNGLSNLRVKALRIKKGGPIYAGTLGDGIFRSTNGGLNWVQVNKGMKYLDINSL
jgi:photosystem II stability/assembly factor-like uncharacterized protein